MRISALLFGAMLPLLMAMEDGKKELYDRQLIIYTLLKENPMLNIADLASKMTVSPRTISRELETLRNLNLIERKDGRKGGCWIVK